MQIHTRFIDRYRKLSVMPNTRIINLSLGDSITSRKYDHRALLYAKRKEITPGMDYKTWELRHINYYLQRSGDNNIRHDIGNHPSRGVKNGDIGADNHSRIAIGKLAEFCLEVSRKHTTL